MMIGEENKMEEELVKKIKEIVQQEVPKMFKGSLFTQDKYTDTPTDALAMVNRKYVTNNGSVAGRPVSSVAVIGQIYVATDLATPTPMWYTEAGWRNGSGSIVAQNN